MSADDLVAVQADDGILARAQRRGRLIPSLVIVFFVIATAGVTPFIPVLGQQLGLDAPSLGLLFGIQGIAGLIIIVPASMSMGVVGAHRFVRWAAAAACASMVLLWAFPSVGALYVALPLLGAAQMLIFMASQMLVVMATDPAHRDQAVATFLFFTSVGVAVGPALGSLAVDRAGGLGGAFLMAAAGSALATVIAGFALPSPATPFQGLRSILAGLRPVTRNVRMSLTTTLIGDFAFVTWGIFLPLTMIAAGHAPAVIGLLFAVRGFATMAVRPAIGLLVAAVSRERLLAASLASVGLGFWLSTAYAGSVRSAAAGSVLFGIGTGLLFPLSLALITVDAEDSRIAPLLGARQFVGRIGQIVGPVIAGSLAALSMTAALGTIAIVSGGTGVWVVLTSRGRLRTHEKAGHH